MPRDMTPAYVAALNARVLRPVFLIEAFLRSGPMRIASAYEDIQWPSTPVPGLQRAMRRGMMTFARAGEAAHVGLDGQLRTVPADHPRREAGRGILVEAAATNLVRNSGAKAARPGVGAAGVLPTFWAQTNGAGLTRTISLAPTGRMPWIQFRFAGKATNALGLQLHFEAANSIASQQGNMRVASAFASLVAGSVPGLMLFGIERNAAGAQVAIGYGPDMSASLSGSLKRFEWPRAMAGAATAFYHPGMHIPLVSGRTYDFTIRIALPQVEATEQATSPILTTGERRTRPADKLVIMPGEGIHTINLAFEDGSSRAYVDEDVGPQGWAVPPQVKFISHIEDILPSGANSLDFSDDSNSGYKAFGSIGVF